MSIHGTMGLRNVETLGVQGWTQFAKSDNGSASIYNNTAAISAGSLNTYNNTGVDAKLSDANIKALLKSGYQYGYILAFSSNDNPVLMRWTHALIDAWSSAHRWGHTDNSGTSARNSDGMHYYNVSTKAWVLAEGHFNHYFISTYSDTADAGQLDLDGDSANYNFHSGVSYVAAGDYSFFGRGV